MIFVLVAFLVFGGLAVLSTHIVNSIINGIADDKDPPEELEQSLTVSQ